MTALTGLLAALVLKPTDTEIRYYQIREKLLIDGEDDLEAAIRGVSRFTRSVHEASSETKEAQC